MSERVLIWSSEKTMRKVADAINDAPAGRVIAASEENVRDLLEEFRQKAYEMGLQMRGDAAEAAFSPLRVNCSMPTSTTATTR